MLPPSDDDVAFHELARIFSIRHQGNEVLEIEILPPGLGPLLQDGNSVGITKKYLIQAFLTARRKFLDAVNGKPVDQLKLETTASHSAPWSHASDQALIVSTEIILLFDCEHLTACNWRKRRLAAAIQSHDPSGSDKDGLQSLIDALHKELSFTKTYLCSPLHRHTKSPTLWNYRSWILSRLIRLQRPGMVASTPQGQPSKLSYETSAGIVAGELAMVLRSGELHPRNYYAFGYLREAIDLVSDTSESGPNVSALLAEYMIQKVLQWCLAHPADISGWAFTSFLLEKVSQDEIRRETVYQVIQFALDIGWEGESLWIFVDSASSTLDGKNVIESGHWASRWVALTEHSLPNAGSQGGWRTWLDRARAVWAAGPAVN
ncbi:uncharacterized protein BO97DRAFT_383090 [Aspergillus homomorphus CBS 101889]|uniref:Uncharacterized protein n=1 Tax=Aspergillus homomorphus (strain CBS 101889) TaxID=1450537 RepID=A0A395I911_ASPHC|nr:hypothetical protein BO97DRAFT_383090 [Aspergillus homomorphus CBS 101889]RAL16521.1 hypothetical protein BO97DRAFT_383090 [Aspergillus homomorphus CBS 101889]